ncbi:hypothetical protein PIB30_109193, partial [Stylosanthes scabra]|nr:hypothetical protein [Stylosanthes scabra]
MVVMSRLLLDYYDVTGKKRQGWWLCPACSQIMWSKVSYRTRSGWPYNRPNELIGHRTDMHHMHLFDIVVIACV